jgi:hypothetical protein
MGARASVKVTAASIAAGAGEGFDLAGAFRSDDRQVQKPAKLVHTGAGAFPGGETKCSAEFWQAS